MNMTEVPHTRIKKLGRLRTIVQTIWISIEYVSFQFFEALGDRIKTMRKEIDLFLGAIFLFIGVLNWSSGKYCDGNTADYLSCTRPATYYYYGSFEIVLVVLGVLLILVWYIKNRRAK